MKHKLSILAALSLSLTACNGQYREPAAGENEVLLAVDVNTEPEDEIRLLSYDFFTDGEIVSGGGINNADGEPLTDMVYYFRVKRDIDVPENADISTLSVQLYVGSELDNINNLSASAAHTGETKVGEPLEISAEWGDTYHIEINGDKESGYTSQLVTE